METDFRALNSATKYPSIETYHVLDPSNGMLTDAVSVFTGYVLLTEKIDGTNGRIVMMPGGDWFIGSREELLYARGDRMIPRTESIVPTLLPLAERIAPQLAGMATPLVWYLEVYGSRIASGAKNYTATAGLTGSRLFDVASVPLEVLSWDRDRIASWREHGGQRFVTEDDLQKSALWGGVQLTPRLGTVEAEKLPQDLTGMLNLLTFYAPESQARLDGSGQGAPEGIVLRTADRSLIAKAKFRDYERSLRKRAMQAGGKGK